MARRERATLAPAAFERSHVGCSRVAELKTAKRSGGDGRKRSEKSAQARARQAAGVAFAAERGKRSCRVVALGRRVGRGGVSVEAKASPNAAPAAAVATGETACSQGRELLEKFRRQQASGRCGASPLEWGARDARLGPGKDISPRKRVSTSGINACNGEKCTPISQENRSVENAGSTATEEQRRLARTRSPDSYRDKSATNLCKH